jgi:electron transfer DM13
MHRSDLLPYCTRFLLMSPVAGILLVGLWFFAGRITDNFRISAALTVLWFAVAGLAVFAVARRWRVVAVPVVAAFLITTLASGGYLAWTTLRDKVVDEQVAVASPGSGNIELARGHFTGDEHHTTGTARVIQLASGERKLTLDLSTSAGPDLRVYLVPGDGQEVDEHRDLGGLKGTQQYTIPPSVSTRTYTAVVIYCRAFSALFGTAVLTDSA